MATAVKKPARKPAARRVVAKKAAAGSVVIARLVPPPGISVAEFLKRLPPPSEKFDAEAVERIVACRSHR